MTTTQSKGNTINVITSPRITEKATYLAEKNVYSFNVGLHATKSEIKKAMKILYGVTPIKVSVSNRPEKAVNYRGKPVVRSGGRKAMVYLKKGDKIELI